MFTLDQCGKYKITVRKLARTLADAGHDVRVIAVLSDTTEPYEESDGARIFRLALNPVHVRVLRLISSVVRFEKKLFSSILRESSQSPPRADVDGAPVNSPQNTAGASLENDTGNGRYQAGGFASVFSPLELIHKLLYMVVRWPITKLPHAYLGYIDYYYRSFRVARQEPVDVYHAHDLVTLPVAWLCSRLAKGKLVYDSHELWLDRPEKQRSRFNRFFVKSIESFLIQRTDANIIAGESSGIDLSERYCIAPPTVVLNVPSYRPFERSTIFRDKLGIPASERIILYMGRISYLRGIEEEVQSLKYLSNCRLVIFGFGPEQYISGLRKLIGNEGLAGRVHFFDAVSFDEVTRYAMSADIGLVLHQNTGLNYYYVSPNKLFECMAAGLPVVGSNFPDLKKYIEGYNLGVTCDPESPKDIAEAIDYILSDETRYNEMRKNALEAAKVFNWENESKKLVALYQGLTD